jgi:hypothetical protein
VPHFCRLTCGPIGRSPRKALSTWSTNDSDIHSHWIYIQRPACIFNLSSSSSSAAGNARSRLWRLAALLSTPRCEALPHRRPGHPSNPPHLLLFSADCSPTPHQNQLTLVVLSVCDSTAASSPSPGRSRPGPRRRPPPWCTRRGVVNKRESSEEDCTWRG